MDSLLIIGNGFDLNLGLPTSYATFTNSKEYHPILKNATNVMGLELHNKCKTCNWIDIENELKMYSREYYYPEQLEDNFDQLKECLKNYLATIDIGTMNRHALAYEVLKSIVQTDFMILDFNYTDTTKRILQELGLNHYKISKQLIKVHGTIADDNIIFGVEDGAEINRKDHIFLQKTSALNFKGIEVTDYLQEHTNLYIFGHSLGETDRTYFQNYFDEALDYSPKSKHEPKGKLTLYHHGKSGYNGLIKQMDAMTRQRNNVFFNKVEVNRIDTSLPIPPFTKVT